MAHAHAIRQVPSDQGYRLWAGSYDRQPNPMLSLEERFLTALLPSVINRDVLDLGCGTGRWLSRFASQAPRSLTGVDSSSEMLERAGDKLPPTVRLFQRDCLNSGLAGNSADLILCSFVLGYLPDIGRFAEEVRRIARDNADLFITELHPETAAELRWNRGFHDSHEHVSIAAHGWSIEYLTFVLERAGFTVVAVLEPAFGEPERELLRSVGRDAVFDSAIDKPAIYLLHAKACSGSFNQRSNQCVSAITSATVAVGAREACPATLTFAEGKLHTLTRPYSSITPQFPGAIDLPGYTVLPGLVNAHDHLEFALFPRLGSGPYRSALDWYTNIHTSAAHLIDQHRRVPKLTRMYWGALRNLLCGVTTVCHHNPVSPEILGNDFPVRVLCDFNWSHSIALSSDFASKHRGTPANQPYIIHLAEGLDKRSASELDELDCAGALDSRTVVVHGLALSEQSRRLLNRRRAALIWCPTSNGFLFGKTHSPSALAGLSRVALGSDSPLSASGDLLDEIRFAAELGIGSDRLYRQVTTGAADVLRLSSGEGQLRIGGPADLFAIRGNLRSPAELLSTSSWKNVHLVLRSGRVFLVSNELYAGLPDELTAGLRPLVIEGELRWVRAPLSRMFSQTIPALGCGFAIHGRRLQHALAAWL